MNNYGFKKTIQDLSGQKYGRWTVVKLARRDKNRNAIWLCRCECGTEREIDGYALRHGKDQTCQYYRTCGKRRPQLDGCYKTAAELYQYLQNNPTNQ